MPYHMWQTVMACALSGRASFAVCRGGDSMPIYRFTLYKGSQHTDLVSSYLSDDEAAIKEAAEIVRDMKGDRPGWWDGWTLRVTAGERMVSEMSFI
jgi:hypothetical protein